MNIDRAILIVLDSAGVGELPDADKFGDVGANTFGNISKSCNGINLPNMEKMGLGNLTDIIGVDKIENSNAAYGKALEQSAGKDTTIGHWEIAGIKTKQAFNTYPDGFPKEMLDALEKDTGKQFICNLPYSGTKVINDYGDQHLETGKLIVYTSADPVLQIAAHEELVPLKELYEICKKALDLSKKYAPVARVIARPFIGKDSDYIRTKNRHDYSITPPEKTIMDKLKDAGQDVIAIGKISDIFAGQGVTETLGTNKDNLDGILKTIQTIKKDNKGLIFTNLVDFDMVYGHRRNPEGYKAALEEFDSYLPEIMENMKDNDILIITADHGCDPTFRGTDHTREYVPILVYGKGVKPANLGVRDSFADIADSLEEILLNNKKSGSFYSLID